MIDRAALLSDLQGLLKRLEGDLLQRSESAEMPQVGQRLREEYERAKKALRTAQNYEDWRSDYITQLAAAWVLSCVFVRFLEDNRLIVPPKIAGPGKELQRARDEHELYFRSHPKLTDRDYLLSVFDELVRLPGTKDVFGEHNPIPEMPNWLSGDAAGELLRFFQKIDANTGFLVHDFTDDGWDTRFLGDLYQDLSEAARKKYALLQTPEFVEEFILDRTLEPALDEFGLDGFRMIDPACGSGHFLLGAFPRILGRWQKKEPGASIRNLVQRTLGSIHGVDVNPYAIAIARFRLLLVAMRAEGIARLADAPAHHINLVCGDSLLHAPVRVSATEGQRVLDFELANDGDECDHAYASENLAALKRLLRPGQYHAVVANPPYIVPRDSSLNELYRKRFASCHRRYSLAVPFMEQVFRLSVLGGYTGQITSQSVAKAEFGRRLIEGFLRHIDLTHVIDTSGAYIPGHGTGTMLVFGRNREPITTTIRTVMGIRGEPGTPEDAPFGLVWSSIVSQVDCPGSENDFVSTTDSPRALFQQHPWSMGGGGAAELKERLENTCDGRLGEIVSVIGRTTHTGEDDAFCLARNAARTYGFWSVAVPLINGEDVRDYRISVQSLSLFPYDKVDGKPASVSSVSVNHHFWRLRTVLRHRQDFGEEIEDRGLRWFDHSMFFPSRFREPLSLAFPFVSTHNHFVLDRGGKVFNRPAPVVKLTTPDVAEYHGVLGLLNSSTVGFWMRQTCPPKGGHGIGRGIQDEAWEVRFSLNSGTLKCCPIMGKRPVSLGQALDRLADELDLSMPQQAIGAWQARLSSERKSLKGQLEDSRRRWLRHSQSLVALQEELDWQCYEFYGLSEEQMSFTETPPPIALGQRAFEIVLSRRIEEGELQTTWFERHGSKPITELPAEWPEDYRRLVERRIQLIESDKNIGLIEKPEHKRRWNTDPWETQMEVALGDWLLDRMESYFDFDGRMNDDGSPTAKLDIAWASVARLADIARQDPDFMQVGELFRDDPAFDVERLVTELVEAESVPLLPVLRYKPSGLRKRAEWERTWELQREEDRTGTRLDIPVPPKYTSADFLKNDYWRLRGKLDVPKERWVSFPHCEGPDGTLVIAWAGYDHLQLARSISAYYVDIQERLGGRDDPRLVPLLACLLELLPWLKQWHNEPDAAYDGMCMGDYFEGFVQEEARSLPRPGGDSGWTLEDIRAWQPPQRRGKGRKK